MNTRSVPLVIDKDGKRVVKSHQLSQTEFKVYREIQFLGDFVDIEDLKLRFYGTPISKAIKKLNNLGYISVMDFTRIGEGVQAIANG